MRGIRLLAVVVVGMVAALTARPLLADTVYLHDGRNFKGKVTSLPKAASVKLQTAMGTMEFRASEVDRIEYGDAAAPVKTDPSVATETPPKVGENPTTEPADPAVTAADPALRAKFIEANKKAEEATAGADGLAVWQEFLKDCPSGPLADLASKRMVVWKDRADKNLAKLGPQWLPKNQVDARLAKADELFAKADSAGNPDEAAKLLDQASAQNPYRVDIPMKKALLYQKAGRDREFTRALGDVIKIDRDNVSALNNLGVMLAQQKQWGAAVANIAKAAVRTDDEKYLDNIDAVYTFAEAAGADDDDLAAIDKAVQQIVAQFRRAGKHVEENRWGESWISEADYQKNVKENAEIDSQNAPRKSRLAGLKAKYARLAKKRKDNESEIRSIDQQLANGPVTVGPSTTTITTSQNLQNQKTKLVSDNKEIAAEMEETKTAATKLQADIKSAEDKKNKPRRAGKMVLVDADGSGQLGTVSLKEDKKGDKKSGGGLFD